MSQWWCEDHSAVRMRKVCNNITSGEQWLCDGQYDTVSLRSVLAKWTFTGQHFCQLIFSDFHKCTNCVLMWLQRHGARRHKQCSSHITLLQVTRALQTILQTPTPLQPREGGSCSAALCSPVQVNWVNHRSSSSSPNFGIPEFHESTRVRRDQCPDCPPSTWGMF